MAHPDARADGRVAALLRGEVRGAVVAWRCAQPPGEQQAAQLREAFVPWISVGEVGRVEHPHSAFVRKSEQAGGRTALRTTLYAPEGKLSELRDGETGEALEYSVRRVADFKALRSYLKDVHPLASTHVPYLSAVGGPPLRELQGRWAAPQALAAALEAGDENQASCLRKLERLFRHRCEEAARGGALALLLGDGLPLGDVDTYLLALDAQLDWLMRHVGLPRYVSARTWDDALAQGLAQRGVGMHLAAAWTTPLEDMGGWEGPLILEMDAEGPMDLQRWAALLGNCPRTLVLLRTAQPPDEETLERLHALAEAIQTEQ